VTLYIINIFNIIISNLSGNHYNNYFKNLYLVMILSIIYYIFLTLGLYLAYKLIVYPAIYIAIKKFQYGKKIFLQIINQYKGIKLNSGYFPILGVGFWLQWSKYWYNCTGRGKIFIIYHL